MFNFLRRNMIEIIFAVVVIPIFSSLFGRGYYFVLSRVYESDDLVFIVPNGGHIGWNVGMLLFLAALIYFVRKAYKEDLLDIKGQVFYMMLIVFFIFNIFMIDLKSNFFYQDKIVCRGILGKFEKIYDYENINRVRIIIDLTRGGKGRHYDFVMEDGRYINLFSYVERIPFVEEKISKNVPHVMRSSDFDKIQNSGSLPYDLYSKFTLVDT